MNSNDDQEEKSLDAVSIQQQFSWTGLCRNAESDASFDDLILWNLLGYAVDTKDYLNLMLVCKQWRNIVVILEPPVITAISRLLQQDKAVTQDQLSLWTTALASLQSRESTLYRKQEQVTREWPTLQPQFNVLLMRFVHCLATQQAPNNNSRSLYELTTNYLQEFSQKTVEKLWVTLEKDGQQPLKCLDELVSTWCEWQGVVEAVDNMAEYLNRRHYVRHENVPPVKRAAELALVNAWRESLNTNDGSLGQGLLRRLGDASMTFDRQERALFLEAWNACEILRALGPDQVPNGWASTHETFVGVTHMLTPVLEVAKTEQEASMQENETPPEKPITIVSLEGQQFSMAAGCHFVTSSGFLTRLRLRSGDVIKLPVQTSAMEHAIEFYQMHEMEPFPEIVKPLISNRLQDIVGERYSNFVFDMPRKEHFELVAVASFLNFKKLLDLCCAAVVIMIQGRSAEEIREMFAIAEEAQAEAENR